MAEEEKTAHGDRLAHNKENIHRIRRVQGQLEALAKVLEADQESCEERVIRARTVEKGVASLINHMIECYIENTVLHQLKEDPEAATVELSNLLKLVNKYK